MSERVTVAVDAVGGDFAPAAVLAGVRRACEHDAALEVLLVGPLDVVGTLDGACDGRILALAAAEIIAMDEHPATAVRTKRDSSIVVGCRAVKEGRAQAFFSAGSTGAAMAAATLIMRRLPGVERPAIATVLPAPRRPVVLLDAGANADCKPEHLLQFAVMGRAYAEVVLGVAEPRVALLNIGEEPTKGSQLARAAHDLMRERLPWFVGNVEGRDVLSGSVDVIVTDGFTGNVTLKVLEGVSRAVLSEVRAALTSTPLARIAALAARPGLQALKRELDPDRYGGAPLLGVDGVCVIGHGSSGPAAIANGIGAAARAARGNLVASIVSAMEGAVAWTGPNVLG